MRFPNPNDFAYLIDKNVRVFCSGKESHEGRLLAVKDDHLVLLAGDQHLYYPLHHVKRVELDTWDNLPVYDQRHSQPLKYIDGSSFHDVLQKMVYRWVLINQNGPERVSGVITRVHDNHVDVVSGQELVKVAKFHIKNICYGLNTKAEASKTEGSDKKRSDEKKGDAERTVERTSAENGTSEPAHETAASENHPVESVQVANPSGEAKTEQQPPSAQAEAEYPVLTGHSPTLEFALYGAESRLPDPGFGVEWRTVEPQTRAAGISGDYRRNNHHSSPAKSKNRRRKRWKLAKSSKTKNVGAGISKSVAKKKWAINKKTNSFNNLTKTVWLAPQVRCGVV